MIVQFGFGFEMFLWKIRLLEDKLKRDLLVHWAMESKSSKQH